MSMTKTSIQDISTTILSHYSQKSMMPGMRLLHYRLKIVPVFIIHTLEGVNKV
jgi:hypothetical protein